MIKKRSLLFWSVELLIVAALIWVCTKLDFIFHPIMVFVSAIFVPLIIASFLFYMLSPLQRLLMKIPFGKYHLNRTFTSLLIILLLILLVVGSIVALIPPVVNELNHLVKWMPSAARQSQHLLNEVMNRYPGLKRIDLSDYYQQFNHQLTNYAQGILNTLTNSAGAIIGTVASTVVVAITVPVMLFYMLKDGNRLVPSVQRFFSDKHATEVATLLKQMNQTLSSYISGQALECLFVAVATSVGYLLIGQPLAVVLGIVAGITNMIPYVGPYIGITPALMVAIALAPNKIIWVIVVVIVVQQIDGNVIYPNIIGKTLKIHPLTIIILLLAAGNIAGIPGMILGIPLYAVVKTIFNYFWSIYRLERDGKPEKQ